MSTSTNFLLRSIFSAIISLSILGAISASTNTVNLTDSCSAHIDVQYDSTGGYAILIVSHSGSPNSTIEWFDSSSTDQITVTSSGQYCVTVYNETQCAVTECVSIDLGAGANCQSYIIKEPLPEGGYMLIAETNDPHPNTSYVWSNGLADNSIIVNQSGEYCVNVTSSYGCPSHACIYVDIPVQNDSCAVTVFSYPDTIYGGAYVSVDPSGIGPFTYAWSNGSSSNGIDVNTSGEYCVTVTDAQGCVGIGCKIVEVSPANHIVTFTVPADIQLDIDVQCYADTSILVTGDVVDEYTTCGYGFEATYTDQITSICGTSYQITRVWSLSDNCGNITEQAQIILVTDNTAPVFTVPADITLYMDPTSCSANTDISITGDVIDEYDNCYYQLDATYTDVVNSIPTDSGCGFNLELLRTWILTDDCGNTMEGVQTIQVVDTTQANQPDSCFFDIVIFEQARTADVVALSVDPAGVAPFNYLWSDGSTGEVLDVLIDGTYCLTVIDGNGCEGQSCYAVVFETTIPDTCSVDIFIYEVERHNDLVKLGVETTDSTILSSAIWSDGSSQPYLYVQEAGNFCVTAIDENGCEGNYCYTVEFDTVADTCNVWIEQIPQADGSVKLWAHGVGGSGSYVFNWLHDQTITEPYFYATESDNYCVLMYDSNQCQSEVCIYVDVITNSQDSCFSQITKTPDGPNRYKLSVDAQGVGPFNIVWHDSLYQDGEYLYVEQSGNYCATVYDINQCVSNACIEVVIDTTTDSCYFNPILHSAMDPSSGDMALSIDPEGVAPYTIIWPDGTDGDYYPVTASGEYCVTVIDANGCYGNDCLYVEVPGIDSCSTWIEILPQDDGRVKIWGHTTGEGPFNHTWSTGNTSISETGEAFTYVTESGQYCITVIDANQCVSEHCVDVIVPTTEPIDSCYSYIVKTLDGSNRYKLSVEAVGEGPFTIVWHDSLYQDGDYLYVEQSGLYCATVYDANQCESNACLQVDISISEPIDSCSAWIELVEQADGSIKLIPKSENPDVYDYAWWNFETNVSYGDDPYLIVTESGRYCLEVDFNNGCYTEVCVDVVIEPTNDSCFFNVHVFEIERNIDVVKLGVDPAGDAPFTYLWTNGSTESYLYAQSEGEYCVTVIDANGCEGTACYVVEFETTTTPDSCSTWIEILPQDDGRVKIWGHTTGEGPFNHTWSTGNTAISETGEAFTYVTESGQYCITVIDANQCISEHCVDVIVPTTVPTDSCYTRIIKQEQSAGFYKLTAETEGQAPFTIIWHDSLYQDGDHLYIEQSGTYCVTVYDVNQCVSEACLEIIIDPTSTDSCSLEVISTIYAEDFVAEVKAESNGTAPFEYIWSDGTSGNAIEMHESKEVCVTVTDATGCVTSKCIMVEVPQRPCTLEIVRGQNSTDSLIVLEAIAEGEGQLTYLWRDGYTDNVRTVSESGEYCLTMTTANGCTKTECIYIDIANVVCETAIEYNLNSTDYEVILDAAPAGVGPYTFAWSDGSVGSTIVVKESGTYCLVVTDARGCVSEICKEVVVAVPVCESAIYIAEERDDEVSISVETSGIAPFEYYWSNGESSKEITVTVSKEYCVEVIDALGCISFDCKYIEVVDYSTCSVEIKVVANADSTEYKVIANPSGTAPFTYQWAHGDTSRFFYPELDGYFCVTVTDAEGCVSETCFKTEGITPSIELEAFPNPAQDHFFVEIDSELEFQGRVEIRDIEGNLLFTTTLNVELGIQGLNFNSDQYPSGVFFVNIIRGSHVESIKVIKAGN